MISDPLNTQVGGNHYQTKVQHVEFCQINRIPWCEAAAMKYIVRHRKKNGRQDVEKAIHYLELLVALDYGRRDEVPTDMEESLFAISIKDFMEANGFYESTPEYRAVCFICRHQSLGEPALEKAIKELKSLLDGYEEASMLA